MTDGTAKPAAHISPARTPAGRTIHALPLAMAVVFGIAGARLVMTGDRLGVSVGVLLLAAALVAGGVAFGSAAYGPQREGPLDLSTRLALGLLGGVLAGLLHGVLTEAAGWLSLSSFLGAGIDVELSALEWWMRAVAGGAWGLGFGVVYPLLPEGTFVKRGAIFGLVIAAWQLLFVYPFRLGLGLAGIDAGLGVAPLVIIGLVITAVVGAWVIAWGGRSHAEPLSAPLIASPK